MAIKGQEKSASSYRFPLKDSWRQVERVGFAQGWNDRMRGKEFKNNPYKTKIWKERWYDGFIEAGRIMQIARACGFQACEKGLSADGCTIVHPVLKAEWLVGFGDAKLEQGKHQQPTPGEPKDYNSHLAKQIIPDGEMREYAVIVPLPSGAFQIWLHQLGKPGPVSPRGLVANETLALDAVKNMGFDLNGKYEVKMPLWELEKLCLSGKFPPMAPKHDPDQKQAQPDWDNAWSWESMP